MKAEERRRQVLTILEGHEDTISASQLAKKLGVSRQVIVGDIALLRAQNHDIISTPKGYLMQASLFSHSYTQRIVCQHGPELTQEELAIIIENGGIVMTVEVEHPIYGMLTAPLNIKSHEDINDFMKKVSSAKAELLSSLTDGIHSHLISCPDVATFGQICQRLKEKGILYQ